MVESEILLVYLSQKSLGIRRERKVPRTNFENKTESNAIVQICDDFITTVDHVLVEPVMVLKRMLDNLSAPIQKDMRLTQT